MKFLSLGHFIDAMTKTIIPTVDDLFPQILTGILIPRIQIVCNHVPKNAQCNQYNKT